MSALELTPEVTDRRELALLKAVGLDRLAPEQRELALNIAARYDLDLLLKHLVMIDGRPYITRDGLLHIAHRSGQLDGMDTSAPELRDGFWYASCSVFRKDMGRPFTYSGRYPEKGKNAAYAPEMAVKVAESMALRRAFDIAAPSADERWDTDLPAAEPAPRPSLAQVAQAKAAEALPLPAPEVEPPDEPEGFFDAPEPVGPTGLPGGAPSEAAVFPDLPAEPEPEPLTARQFNERLAASKVPVEVAAAAFHAHFPNTDRMAELTNEERGSLLAIIVRNAGPAA